MAFSYRKLIVYERALQYDTLVAELIPMIRQQDRSLADHLERSTNSFLTNTSEGGSEDRPLMKANFYRVAKREAEECALCLDKALRRGYTPRGKTEQALSYLEECVLMLASLIRRFDPPVE